MFAFASASRHHANRLLAVFPPDDFARLAPHFSIVDLSLGSVLYEGGERVEYAYFPHDSLVSLVAVLEQGGIVEMAVFGREGVVGFASSLVTRESFGRYVVQMEGRASRISIKPLQDAVNESPSLRELLLRYVQALLSQTFQAVACNAAHSVEARCCKWLLTTHDRVGRRELSLTHEFLAEMLGVRRTSVTDVASHIQKLGPIIYSRGVIRIVDREALEGLACECYQTLQGQ